MTHRVGEHAADLLAAFDDARMDAVPAPMRRLGIELLRDPEAELVDRAPRFRRHDVARRAHALSRERERRPNRARVVAVRDEEALGGVDGRARMHLAVQIGAARDLHDHVPREARLARQVEHQIAVHAREPRRRLGALEIARGPVEALGDARQEAHRFTATIQVSLLPPPCDEFTTNEPRRSATRVKPPGVTQTPRLAG